MSVGVAWKRLYSTPGFLGVFFGVVTLDITTKWLATAYLRGAEPIVLVPGWLSLAFVRNEWIAFSLPVTGLALQLLSVGLVAFLIWHSTKIDYDSRMERLAYAGLLAWGICHTVERIAFGSVVDFVSVPFFSVFNVADTALSVSAVFLLIASLCKKQ